PAEAAVVAQIVVGQLGQARGCVPGDDRRVTTARGHEQRDEAAKARAEQADAPVEPGMAVEVREDRLYVFEARRDRRVLLATARLAAPAVIEARERETGPRQRLGEEQIFVGVLRRGQSMARYHARESPPAVGHAERGRELAVGQPGGM